MTTATKKTSKMKAWALRNPRTSGTVLGAAAGLYVVGVLVATAYVGATLAVQQNK